MGLEADEPDEAEVNGRAALMVRRRAHVRPPGAFLLQVYPERPVFQTRAEDDAESDEDD